MLNMKETALLVLIISFAAALTASLILGAWTYEVQLVTTPNLQNIYVPADATFNISCEGQGGDESKFSLMKWLNPTGNVVPEGIPGVVKSGNNLLYLTFTNPKIEDSGTYTCTAVYDKNYRLKYLANIKFYGPAPEFESIYDNVTAAEGSRVELLCFALGEKPMTYRWYDKNDVIIPEVGTDIVISSSGDESRLIITAVEKRHQGMYTCSAENDHGLLSKLYNLKVSPKQDNVSDNNIKDIRVENISARSVQFSISVDESVKEIEVKYSDIRNTTEYRTRFTTVSENLYTVDHLIPSGFYRFQFKTSDAEGWSDVYNVTLLPDVPALIFRKIEGTTITFVWWRSIDDIMRGTIDKHEIKYYTVGMQSGNTWIPSTCVSTIEVPSCAGSQYTISGLQNSVYYQLEVRAHTESGYGEPAMQKIYVT